MKREIEELRERLAYNPETGDLTWKVKPNRRILVGAKVGAASHGYLKTRVMGVEYMVHRLVWAVYYGEWPKNEIDHINGVRNDNRIANLRDVTRMVNAQNMRSPKKNNRTGVLGVIPERGRFSARLCIDGAPRHVGMFGTPEEAHAAYVAAKRLHHEGNTL